MEKRKDFIRTLKMCRFCLSRDDSLTSLYPNKPNNQKSTRGVPLSLKILACLSIEVFPSDKMLSYICERCNFFIDLFYEYKQICRRADERILQYVQSGTTLQKLIWPASLMNIFHYSIKNAGNTEVVETLVKGGTTIQVTSQGSNSDEEEEEEENENVYDIKIAGQSLDGTKCIKVTSKADVATSKTKSKQQGEYRNIQSGSFPCNECDNSFPLQQLLDLHKTQKHRERTEECDQCSAKFFSKYDLAAHLARHTKETPFHCVACDKSFKRLDLLKRHEKVFHMDLPKLSCSICQSKFLSIEELQAHEKRHARHSTERSYECAICERKFYEKASLNRHIYLIHDKKPMFSCEYCPERFTSLPKLTRHVRSHAGDRPYPCKFCDKSFMKSHHYTRHLRLKHRESFRQPRLRRSESFRCEQCEAAFGTQDELIYHSAIHATQNLTCPLCQEKFENVDAVTAHIKSHVNGMEFMCDLCELVFTSKDKLDNHLTLAHAEEIAQELGQNESSMEMDAEDYEDDNSINVKEEDGEMVVEIKKSSEFLTQTDSGDKTENTNSEGSETEMTYTELATVDTLALIQKQTKEIQNSMTPSQEIIKTPVVGTGAVTPTAVANSDQTATILRKAEEVKRKLQQTTSPAIEKKEKSNNRVESSTGGASDKSLRLLEKELQELKRTNTRTEPTKTPAKPVENLRNRRPQLFTSTPKTRQVEEKKLIAANKILAPEKKTQERRTLTKENKESKESKTAKEDKEKEAKEKEIKEREIKEREMKDKEAKEKELKEKELKEKEIKEKEAKEKEVKEKELKEKEKAQKEKEKELKEKDVKVKEAPKNAAKNGTSGKSQQEENKDLEKVQPELTPQRNDKLQPEEAVRRSNRPSKIKDYARMIRDKSQTKSDAESDDGDDEYKEKTEVTPRSRSRRLSAKSAKTAVTPPAAAPTPARKRGRPRKDLPKEVPSKVRKEDVEEEQDDDSKVEEDEAEESESITKETTTDDKEADIRPNREDLKTPDNLEKDADNDPEQTSNSDIKAPTGVLVSPTGQALKKVSLKALPPGIKRLPLPMAARPITSGELCEMQIGKKVVKVQKIVMTKAEVEAMAKKGLVEMKDGTMVLKQGIKLPTSESLKSSLATDKVAGQESLTKSETTK